MKTFENNGKIIAILYRDEDWPDGLNFFTPPDLNIQVSTWKYNKDKKIVSHVHKINPRNVDRTHEVTYVKDGRMKVLLYDENKKFLEDFIVSKGDTVVYAYGGHGYEILSDNTQVIEIKNGPFVDVSTDKEKIE